MSTYHQKKAEGYLKSASNETVSHHDATFWNVRAKRDRMAKALPEWEQLRAEASRIKTQVLMDLENYLNMFENAAKENGVIVHHAKDAQEHNQIVLDILQSHQVKKIVKSKSMLTEECHMNPFLEASGIEVVETDLGERILQMMELAPSHIVMPALHVRRQDIRDCFMKKIPEYQQFREDFLKMSKKDENQVPDDDPTMLTYVARRHLRNHFNTADAGMTGGNFAIAATGDIVISTNEGNADMSTALPPLHIASIGIEKLIPDYKAMGVFQRLLARCGTGQETTVYTSHFRGPRPGGEMHVILVDNGRREILKMKDHWQTLKCMRCGACMNTCPVYRRSTGYSYSYFIPGPIGINLGMAHDAQKYYGNVSGCTLCCSCDNVCPVKVDLSTQIYKWRQELDGMGKAPAMKKLMSKGMKFLFLRPSLYQNTLKMAPLANIVPDFLMECGLNPWAEGHKMMTFPKKSFHALFKEGIPSPDIQQDLSGTPVCPLPKAPKAESGLCPTTYEDPVQTFIQTARTISGAKVIESGQEDGALPDSSFSVKGEIGVAENGCIWIPQTMEDRSPMFSSEHLDIYLSRKDIVSNMHEAYERIAQSKEYFSKYKFGTFISGPSKTADIEGALVYGAQAARSVTIHIED